MIPASFNLGCRSCIRAKPLQLCCCLERQTVQASSGHSIPKHHQCCFTCKESTYIGFLPLRLYSQHHRGMNAHNVTSNDGPTQVLWGVRKGDNAHLAFWAVSNVIVLSGWNGSQVLLRPLYQYQQHKNIRDRAADERHLLVMDNAETKRRAYDHIVWREMVKNVT